jgi:GNAT superfamily N-acetyltransferase
MRPLSRLGELIADWKYLFLQNGAKPALALVGSEIARLPYRHLKFHVFAHSLSDPLPDLKSKIPLEIRPLERNDLFLLRKIERPSEVNLSEKRLAHGHKGLIALYQGQPAGYAWGCPEVDPQLERVHLTLAPGDVLLTDVFTSPPFRGQGIQTTLTLERFRLFRDLGYQRAISYIEIHNAPSLAVWQRKLGSPIIGHVDFIRIGFWYRVRFS